MKFLGYSLLELLVTISIASILMFLAVPSWQAWISRHQTEIYANQIIAALRFARAQAIINGVNVIYCASDDGKNCGDHWDNGQVIIADSTHQVLRIFSAVAKTIHVRWQSSFTLDHFIKFSPTGFTVDQQGSFYVCAQSRTSGFRIRVVRSGRVSMGDYRCL